MYSHLRRWCSGHRTSKQLILLPRWIPDKTNSNGEEKSLGELSIYKAINSKGGKELPQAPMLCHTDSQANRVQYRKSCESDMLQSGNAPRCVSGVLEQKLCNECVVLGGRPIEAAGKGTMAGRVGLGLLARAFSRASSTRASGTTICM